MTRKFTALAVAASLALGTLATSAPAHAGNGKGAAFVAGLVGGAIIGGVIAQSQHHDTGYGYERRGYEPRRFGYVERDVVVERVYEPTCKKITIEDDYGNVSVTKRCR